MVSRKQAWYRSEYGAPEGAHTRRKTSSAAGTIYEYLAI
jgi:hypothetical protein